MSARQKAAAPKASTPRRRRAAKKPVPEMRPLSLPTLEVLQTVLNLQKLDVNAGDFEQIATDVIRAKGELSEQIAAAKAAQGATEEESGDGE